MRRSWLVVCVGCASARPPAPPAPVSLSPSPEQIERTEASVSCGPALEVPLSPAFATLSRTPDSIVLASPDTAVIVVRGEHDIGAELHAVADALQLMQSDF